jgi:DNA polymerase-3 subunit alpha
MMKKAATDGMKAVALTDHGNMFGAFKFVAEAEKQGVKPIVGCEFYLVADRHKKQFTKASKDVRYHQLLLAKNAEGYKNLSKLCSLGFIDGYYSKYPRIDKEILQKYATGLIATSCCIGAEIPQTIIHKGEAEAEKVLKWYVDLFGKEDFYIELQRHGLMNIDNSGISQEDVNQTLLRLAKKYDLKVIATNDSHYVNEKDFDPHDILLCINTGEKYSTPKGDGKGQRFGFPNSEFFFKTQAEMNKLFGDLPQALDFTCEIADKVDKLKLKRDILLPNFPLPQGFATQDDFLKHLAFQGAAKKYGVISSEIEQRLNYELEIIQKMGFPGYFLIVQDFINAAKDIGVWVGPGRGSAAGSAVAYCVNITNVDPIKYKLLFERFLNPERVSMPDIDIDFDDEGRSKVIDYVVDKYGKNQVAQIVTYGTMAAKMSIKDVSRVLELPLNEANELAKLVPEKPGTTLAKAYEEVPELAAIRKGNDLRAKVLQSAEILEGSVRGTGIHAAGVIIAPDDITNYIPVCLAKDKGDKKAADGDEEGGGQALDLLVTQFDGKHIEDAGMLKMDFLGLKTLTIMRDAIDLIQQNHGVLIDLDKIPMDDLKTYQLYQKGNTVGTFQFESEGMQMYLRDLKPTNIEDLIAMNALYRPGPMDFIPTYINRKHGKEVTEYPHELLEPILNYTFGIMVYQEQIMQTAQVMAGYSLGGADLLRRAMGKKDKEKMAKEKDKFIEGAKKYHNIEAAKSGEVFAVMEKFAEYGFNRSHSAAYSVVAYQTAYLKANYPAEYMAAVMTHSMGTIEKISFFLEECKRMGIKVLGPDVNESKKNFSVNSKGEIRFGMGAVKGTGEVAVEEIIAERTANGHFKNIFEFASRVNLRTVNKKTFESLATAGGFDEFKDVHRAMYFAMGVDGTTNLEKIVKYGAAIQGEKTSGNTSLFLGGSGAGQGGVTVPKLTDCDKWTTIEMLDKEKEVVGFYLSGHPLDPYKADMETHCTCSVTEFAEHKNKDIALGGILTDVSIKQSKTGKTFALANLTDYNGTLQIAFFGDDYTKNLAWLKNGEFVYIKGKVEERYNQPNSWDFRPKAFMHLADLREKMTKFVEIILETAMLSSEIIQNINSVLAKHNGNCELRVKIIDNSEDITLPTRSTKFRINPSNEFLSELRGLGVVGRVG